jgi:hypothetical protein
VGGQELERVNLEEDGMEEQVPRLRPLKGIFHQTLPDKVLVKEENLTFYQNKIKIKIKGERSLVVVSCVQK